ncbi:MAG: YitT family protein [Clostridium sp.]|nr:YitT family protein [Clostridium sp.]
MKEKIKEYVLITIGFSILAIAIKFFLAPNKIAAGGISGIAIIIKHFIPSVSIGVLMLCMDAVLFTVAVIVIGGKFGAKTLYTSLGLSGLIAILDKFIPSNVAVTHDLLLATIFGTFISGIGMGLVFNQNASTGGTDIIAKIINKFVHIDIGKSLLMVDLVIAVIGGIIFTPELGMYGVMAVVLNGFMIDTVIEGLNTCKAIMIMSSQNELINQYIIKELDRGCTMFDGKGAYSGNNISVLYTVLDRKQFIKLKNYIKEIDKKAFITVSEAHEVLGEGFKDIVED